MVLADKAYRMGSQDMGPVDSIQIKRFEDPVLAGLGIEKLLGEGIKTKKTDDILRVSAMHDMSPTLETVQSMINASKRLEKRELSSDELERLYAKRTAGQIWSSGYVCMGSHPKVKRPNKIYGCLEYADALLPLIRMRGIPAAHVRTGCHSSVYLMHEGIWHCADPTSPIRKRESEYRNIIRVDPDTIKFMSSLVAYGVAGVGVDSADIKINDVADYDRYSKSRADQQTRFFH